MPRSKISDLLAQLPLTDKELPPSPPPKPEDKKRRQEPDHDPNGAGSKFTGPPPELARELVAKLFAGGRKSVAELVNLVHAPGDKGFKDYKAEYLLHCAVLYAGKNRGQLIAALTSRLKNAPDATGQILLRELQWLRGRPSAEALLDKERCDDAAAALVSSEKPDVGAIRSAWPKAGRECRLALVQALGRLKDSGAVSLLRQALADADGEVRLLAAWALARVGDELSASALVGLAGRAKGYERAKLTSACLELGDSLRTAGKTAVAMRLYTELSHQQTGPKSKHIRDVISRCISELERSSAVS